MSSYNEEEQLKRKAAAEQCCANSIGNIANSIGGMAGCSTKAYRPPSLRERLRKQLAYAKEETRKLDALSELEYLLDKHPDVARILDLIDRVDH